MSNLESYDSNLTDSNVQRHISERLSNFIHTDLTIPAQRQVANDVRKGLGLPALREQNPVIHSSFLIAEAMK